MATNFIVGRSTASAIASASRKSFFCHFEYGRTYRAGIRPRIVAERLELRLHWGRTPSSDASLPMRQRGMLASRVSARLRDKLPAQNDGAHFVEADEVERVLADVDADCRTGFKVGGLRVAWDAPGVGSPAPTFAAGRGRSTAGPSHQRPIREADIATTNMIHPLGSL